MLFKAHPLRDPAFRSITQRFGENPSWYTRFTYDGVALRGHNGIDFGVPLGCPVQAVADGSVLENNYDPEGFGYYVKLQHGWGHSLYGHLSRPGQIGPGAGQPVGAGEVVGLSGSSGNSTGPHLHFGIRINPFRRSDGWGGFSDPLPYLEELQQMPTPQPDPSALQETAWSILGIPYNAEAALARYARANNLGAPLTREFTFGSYQCQGYVLGIAFCPNGQWDQVQHIPW